MTKTRILAPVILLLCAWIARAEDDFPIHVYPCLLAQSPPKMDGALDDPVWQNAPLVSGFIRYDKAEPVEIQTSFRILYDADYLYFGVRCDEPLMDKLSAVACARDDAAVFHGECLEFFVDPNHDHDRYCQLGVNAAGSLYDSERANPVWNSESKAAAHLGKDSWSVELAIPWKALKVEPKPGAILGFNVCRDRYLGPNRSWSCWSQVNANFHDPQRFAHLVLSGTPQMVANMGPEFRKSGRTGAITVFSAEGFAQTTYAELAKRTLDDLDKLIADMEAVQKSETDAAAAADLARRLAVHRKEAADLRAQARGKLDAASWTKMDQHIQKLMADLRQSVWEARLNALLSSI